MSARRRPGPTRVHLQPIPKWVRGGATGALWDAGRGTGGESHPVARDFGSGRHARADRWLAHGM